MEVAGLLKQAVEQQLRDVGDLLAPVRDHMRTAPPLSAAPRRRRNGDD
jgi:hypothetical protein